MGVAAETKEAEAKDFPILQLGKKENPPTPARNSRWRRLCQVLDEPPSANLFLFLIACAKRMGVIAAGMRLWVHHHHQPSPFYS